MSVASYAIFGAKWRLLPRRQHLRWHWGTAERGTEGRSTHKVLVKGEFSAIKHLIYKRFSARHEEMMSSRRVLFWIWGDARIGITTSVPENFHLKACPTGSPGAQGASLSTLNCLQRVSEVTAAAARDPASAEAGGRCPRQAHLGGHPWYREGLCGASALRRRLRPPFLVYRKQPPDLPWVPSDGSQQLLIRQEMRH